MKKFTKLILGAVFSVGCLFAFVGCNNSDYAAEIQSLKDRIGELEEMIDPPSGDSSGDSSGGSSGSSFTGSPKFNYDSIDEPISYYIQGTKIFDFTITDFKFNDNSTVFYYSCAFTPEYNEEIETAFSVSLYGLESNTLYPAKTFSNGSGGFRLTTGETSKITLRYHGNPFACITAKPRRVSNYG